MLTAGDVVLSDGLTHSPTTKTANRPLLCRQLGQITLSTMTYHDPACVRAVRLTDVTGVSVVLGCDEYQQNFLVVGDDAPTAIFLDGDYAWHSLPVANTGDRTGLLIEGVRLEVDIRSRIDGEGKRPKGCLLRRGGSVSIVTTHKPRGGFPEDRRIDVIAGLSDDVGVSVGFTRWRVVKGDGQETQIILEFDVGKTDEPD